MPEPWSRRQIEVVSGLTAGFSTTIVTHPLDLIKVRLQLSHGPSSKPFDLLSKVIHEIGDSATKARDNAVVKKPKPYYLLQQCYRGVGPNLLGNVSAWGIYFSLYSEFKNVMPSNEGTATYFTASTLAGMTTSIVTNPIWVLKTRILSTPNNEKAYRSVADGIRQICNKEGVRTFWKGTVPSLFLVFQASLQFTFYDHAKLYLTQNTDASSTSELTTMQYIYASVFSKTLSMSILYPSQVVRSRLQSYNFEQEQRTIAKVVKQIWQHEGGWRGFYRGLSANIVRVLPSTCIMFLSYESTKRYLSGL